MSVICTKYGAEQSTILSKPAFMKGILFRRGQILDALRMSANKGIQYLEIQARGATEETQSGGDTARSR